MKRFLHVFLDFTLIAKKYIILIQSYFENVEHAQCIPIKDVNAK